MGKYDQFLRRANFFKNLNDSDIHLIDKVCREQNYLPGEVIFVEGSLAENFFIILEGEVEIWKDYKSQNQDLLALLGIGRMFGELALLDELPRSATVVAKNEVKLLCISRFDFNQIVNENAAISLSIAQSVSAMVRKSNDNFVESLRSRNQQLQKAYQELEETYEELLRAERLSAIGKFSSLILHDIRNPLSVLRGYAELIVFQHQNKETVLSSAKKIISEADRLNELASELLDYSRGGIKLDMALVNISEFIEKFVESLSENFKARDIGIQVDVPDDLHLIMDEKRMLRVFYNLSSNAQKAMPKGGTFSIRVWEKKRFVAIEVSDTGIGMSMSVQRKLFDPFFTTFKQSGTGLGMTIVKTVLEAHDGALSVKSAIGEGTTLTLLLPRLMVD